MITGQEIFIRKLIREELDKFGDDYDLNKHNFNTGDCDIYAVSLHRLYGYPLYVIRGYFLDPQLDEYDYEDCHIMVKLPNGKYMDSGGEQTKQEMISRAAFMNNVTRIKIVQIDEETALNTFSCQDQEEDIKRVMGHIKSNNNIEQLNEDYNSDIQFSNEAKRVYNKIIKNLSKIKFTPTPNDNEREFVEDTRGNVHILYGVKFNLQQLGEKYDLDILLVHRVGRESYHYDGDANRIVFFILSQTNTKDDLGVNSDLARLRFKSWVGEHIFIHEFIHFLDKNRYGDTYSFTDTSTREKYYNSPQEYNAFTQEIITKILKNKNKLKGLSFDVFLKKALKFGDDDFIKNLNDEYIKKLRKRLYQIYINILSEKS